MDATNLDMVNKQKDKNTRKTFEIIQSIADLNKSVYSNNISIAIEYKTKIAEFKKNWFKIFKFFLPCFTPYTIKRMYHKLSHKKNAYDFFNSISGLSTLSDKDKQTFDLDNIMRLYNLQGKLNRKLLNFAYIQKKIFIN